MRPGSFFDLCVHRRNAQRMPPCIIFIIAHPAAGRKVNPSMKWKNCREIFSRQSDYQQSRKQSPGMHEGAAAPSYEIRSGDMCAARSGCKPLPISFGVCPKGAREMMFFVFLPMQVCVIRLASTACRQYFVDKLTAGRFPPGSRMNCSVVPRRCVCHQKTISG